MVRQTKDNGSQSCSAAPEQRSTTGFQYWSVHGASGSQRTVSNQIEHMKRTVLVNVLVLVLVQSCLFLWFQMDFCLFSLTVSTSV